MAARARSGPTGDALEELVGEVLGVHHADPASGFGVVELDPGDGAPGERCSGPLADLVEGQTVRLVGRRRDHPRHGPTFEAVLYEQVAPASIAALTTFLASDRFAAVPEGDRLRVLTVFGSGLADVIEREPERLVGEAGLEAEAARSLTEAWQTGRALARLVAIVAAAGWPMDAARSAHARFGADVVSVAESDPYALLAAERVRFAHVDALALSLGVARDDPRRAEAGALAALGAARRSGGHQHLAVDELVAAAGTLLGVDRVLARAGLDAALAAGALEAEVLDGVMVVSTPAALAAERGLAAGLARLLDGAPPPVAAPALAEALSGALTGVLAGTRGDAVVLTQGQQRAVERALSSGVSVLTGGPGTGKTTALDALVATARALGLNVALAAPTGRAAKRLEEVV
ncbi:MAG: hypothetical protein RLZZ272_1648, partial [Actinomycetota bacterium]